MIAEAATRQQQQQERRRSAARQQTNAALRDALAQRDGLPTEGPPLGCAERQRSAAQQQTIEAFWKRVEERKRTPQPCRAARGRGVEEAGRERGGGLGVRSALWAGHRRQRPQC